MGGGRSGEDDGAFVANTNVRWRWEGMQWGFRGKVVGAFVGKTRSS